MSWLRSFFLRRRIEREMQQEMEQHLARATERFIARGLSPEAARAAARREFGNVHYLQEKSRDVRGGRWLESLSPDAKLALRMLVKNPVLSVVGGLGMAVAIAIGTGFFTFMTFYYSDAPVEDGDRVVSIAYIRGEDAEMSRLFDYQLWKAELQSFDDLAAYRTDDMDVLTPLSGPIEAEVGEMTASAFRIARIRPVLGRPLLDSDELEGAPRVVVIGFREWQQHFGADPNLVGSEIRVRGEPHTVVGVMPESFRLPVNQGFWRPLLTGTTAYPTTGGPELRIFGRLSPGVDAQAAEAEAAAIAERLSEQHPQIYGRFRPAVRPYIRHIFDVQQYPGWVIWLIQLFAVLILALVAVNVAVLIYARTALRRGEITVRSALGASRSRIVTQLFLEALALSAAAAALGLVLAQVGYGQMTLIDDVRDEYPYWLLGSLPTQTILYAAGVSVLAAFIVGVLPALQATGRQLQVTLKELGGGAGLRMGKTWTVLICVQVAVAVGILPAVVGIAWNNSSTTTPLFPASEILSLQLRPAASAPGSAGDGPQLPDEFGSRQAELLRRVEGIPGVTAVTFVVGGPTFGGQFARIEIEGSDAPTAPSPESARSQRIDIGYFELFEVPLLAGRRFDRDDTEESAASVIVNRSFVDEFFGGGNALGRRFRELGPRGEVVPRNGWLDVVGVVEDMHRSRGGERSPGLYRPIALGTTPLNLVVRTRGADPASIAPRVREITADVAPGQDLDLSLMDDSYRQDQAELRFLLVMVGLITVSVLLLSAAGISAMMSFAVTRRQREMGIRSALGATRAQVLTSIFARSARQLATGLILGAAAAATLDRMTGGEMLEGQVVPLIVFVAAIMIAAALLATLGPARRALRIQPMVALREE
jgi:putative ABC transport system permease protein